MQNAAPSAAAAAPLTTNTPLKAGDRRSTPPSSNDSEQPAAKKRKEAPSPQGDEDEDDEVDPRLLRHKNRELSVLSRRLKRKIVALRSDLQAAERQRLQSLGAASCLRRGWDQLEEGLVKVLGEPLAAEIAGEFATSAGDTSVTTGGKRGLVGHILKPMVRLTTANAPHYGVKNSLMDAHRDDQESKEELVRLRQHILLDDDPALARAAADADDRVLELAPKDIHARVQRTTAVLTKAWTRIGKLEQIAATISSSSSSSASSSLSSTPVIGDSSGGGDARNKLVGELLRSVESREKVELALAKSRFLMDALNTSQEALLTTRHKLEDAELQCRHLERRYSRAKEQRERHHGNTDNDNFHTNNNSSPNSSTATAMHDGSAASAGNAANSTQHVPIANGINGAAGAANHQQHQKQQREVMKDAQVAKANLEAELAAVEKVAADRLQELNVQLQERVTLHEALRLEQGRVAAALTPNVLHNSREYKDLVNALDEADYRRRLVVRDLQEERTAHEQTQRHYHDARERLEELESVTGKQWQEYSINQQRIATSLEEQVLSLQRENAEKNAALQDMASVHQRAVELDTQLSASRGLTESLRARLVRPERRDAATIVSLREQVRALEARGGGQAAAGKGEGASSEHAKVLENELALRSEQLSDVESELDQMGSLLMDKEEEHKRLLAQQQEKQNQNATLMRNQMKQNNIHRTMVVEQRLLREKAETEAQLRTNIQAKMALLEERVGVAEVGHIRADERSTSYREQLDQAVGELETAKSSLEASTAREERLLKANEQALDMAQQHRTRNEDLTHGMNRADEKIVTLRAKLDKAKTKLTTSRQAASKAITEAVYAAKGEMRNGNGSGGGGARRTDHGEDERQRAQESALRCPILQMYWKDCILIKCGHMFCRKAVTDNLAKRNRKCPTCKAPYDTKDIMTVSLYMDNTYV